MSEPAVRVRAGGPEDLAAIREIQSRCPEAAAWEPAGYLDYELRVAILESDVAGFLVGRRCADAEREILNLAVHPGMRRKGVGKALLEAWISEARGAVYIEVRESNAAALAFYKSLKFQEVGCRREYYQNPREGAIVLNFHSC